MDAQSAVTQPGEHPPVPATRDDLLFEALRLADRQSVALNELDALLMKIAAGEGGPAKAGQDVEKAQAITLRRFSDLSGLQLFIAATNLRIPLPEDLQGEDEQCVACEKPIKPRELRYAYNDGPVCCADCAPTWAEALSAWQEQLACDPETQDSDFKERFEAFAKALAAHCEAGGSRDDKVPMHRHYDPPGEA